MIVHVYVYENTETTLWFESLVICEGGPWILVREYDKDIPDPPGPGGTTDYNQLNNKPLINNVTLSGNKTSKQLNIEDNLPEGGTAGQVLTKKSDALNDAEWRTPTGGDWSDITNKPTINGKALEGNKTSVQLGINGLDKIDDVMPYGFDAYTTYYGNLDGLHPTWGFAYDSKFKHFVFIDSVAGLETSSQSQYRMITVDGLNEVVATLLKSVNVANSEPAQKSEHAYAVGDYVLYKTSYYEPFLLWRVTKAIAVGDMIHYNGADKNIEQVTVGSELKRIEEQGGGTAEWNDIINKPTDLAEAVELTQAEYNALTEEEKKNGKIYFITDGEDGGSDVVIFDLTQPFVYTEVNAAIDSKKRIGFVDDVGNTIWANGIQSDTEGRYFTGYFRGDWYTIVAREVETAWDVSHKAVATKEYVDDKTFTLTESSGDIFNMTYAQLKAAHDAKKHGWYVGSGGNIFPIYSFIYQSIPVERIMIFFGNGEGAERVYRFYPDGTVEKENADTGWMTVEGEYIDWKYRKKNGVVYITFSGTIVKKEIPVGAVNIGTLPTGCIPTQHIGGALVDRSGACKGFLVARPSGAFDAVLTETIGVSAISTIASGLSYPV